MTEKKGVLTTMQWLNDRYHYTVYYTAIVATLVLILHVVALFRGH